MEVTEKKFEELKSTLTENDKGLIVKVDKNEYTWNGIEFELIEKGMDLPKIWLYMFMGLFSSLAVYNYVKTSDLVSLIISIIVVCAIFIVLLISKFTK